MLIRKATVTDVETIARQRVQMFHDNQLSCTGTWDDLERASRLWLTAKISKGEYVGLLLEDDAGQIIGGAGVWFMEWPPHYLHLEPERAYLLNFYISQDFRGRGLAKKLVFAAERECRERGVRIATLHASKMGKPVYTAMDWKEGNEMIKRFD